MKKILVLTLFIIAGTKVFAQTEISVVTIFQTINEQRLVAYENIIVVGDLDLTELSNKKESKKGKQKVYKSHVEAPVSFKNCIFKGDIIAYKNSEETKRRKLGRGNIEWNIGDGISHVADFGENIVFENCTFEGKTEFKYSYFFGKASFEQSKFSQSANFKYATFKQEANFSKVNFWEHINFKYATFKQDADFFGVKFRNYADFKYADFNRRATFKNALFISPADFKYAEFNEDANFDNTRFKAGIDMKYSNGKRYLE